MLKRDHKSTSKLQQYKQEPLPQADFEFDLEGSSIAFPLDLPNVRALRAHLREETVATAVEPEPELELQPQPELQERQAQTALPQITRVQAAPKLAPTPTATATPTATPTAPKRKSVRVKALQAPSLERSTARPKPRVRYLPTAFVKLCITFPPNLLNKAKQSITWVGVSLAVSIFLHALPVVGTWLISVVPMLLLALSLYSLTENFQIGLRISYRLMLILLGLFIGIRL